MDKISYHVHELVLLSIILERIIYQIDLVVQPIKK